MPSACVSASREQLALRAPWATTASSVSIIYEIPLS
jgi:hypothetical protein